MNNKIVAAVLTALVLAYGGYEWYGGEEPIYPGAPGDSWCNNDFAKRIDINVNNTGGSALTDYQVYVNLTANPINETSLRVYNTTSCTLRPHWTENETGGNSYGIWINYSSIAASSWVNNTAIYYDNAAANSTKNIRTTFLFGDDFDYLNLTYDCKTSLDNNTRLNRYLKFVFRGDDAVAGISEYYDRSTHPDQWYPYTSTELAGMTIEGYVDMYDLNPPFINATERADVLTRAKSLADYIMANQYNMDGADVDKRGGFEIHPENPNNRIFVWGTAPDVSGLVALYKATSNNTYKIAAENATKWLLRAENPATPGSYRQYYDHATTSWSSDVEYASAACRAYFDMWNITSNSTYYDNGVEAADRLVATKSGWWGGACGEHCNFYAARDGLLWAYIYTNNITYLNTAKEFEATIGNSKRTSYYINAQILRFRYDLYNITSDTTYILNGNKFAEYMWEETFVNESGEDDYGVWFSSDHAVGLHTSSDLWILRAQTLKESFGLSLIDCDIFNNDWIEDEGNWVCENGYVRPPQTGKACLRAINQLPLSTDFIVHNRVKIVDDSRFVLMSNSDSPLLNIVGYAHFFKTGAGGYFDITTDGANEQYKASALESGSYCDYIVRIKNGDHFASAYYSNGTFQDSLANTYNTANAEKWFGFYANGYADLYIDHIFVRKYASSEPSTTLGSEEQQEGTTPVISNIQNGSISSTSQYIDWDVNQTAHNQVVYDNGYVSADSTACEGQWSATHACANASDGNWSSYAESAGALYAYAYFNYTVPTGASQSESLWHVKDAVGHANLTISSACWGGTLYLRAMGSDIGNSITWQCDNGPSWTTLRTSVANIAYEQEMKFKYTSSWDNSTAAPNITLSGLIASTLYEYQAWSYNTSNTSLSDNSSTLSFTTSSIPGIIVKQWIDVSSYNNTHVIYNLTSWAYNTHTSALNVSVYVDANWTDYNINSLAPSASDTHTQSATFVRPLSDANFTAAAAILGNEGAGTSNTIKVFLPVDPPSKAAGANDITILAGNRALFCNWSEDQTFQQIQTNLTNTTDYFWYNSTSQKWTFYNVSRNINQDNIVDKHNAVMVCFNKTTTVSCNILSAETITIPSNAWYYTALRESTSKTLIEIVADITADGCAITGFYAWNSTARAYTKLIHYSVLPNEGFAIYATTGCPWDGSI